MTYSTSVNIEIGIEEGFQYIVTPNVQGVLGEIVSSLQIGIHSFTIIGTYGTGKSSFIMALEEGLQHGDKNHRLVPNRKVFFGCDKFTIINVVGEFKPLKTTLARKFNCQEEDVLDYIRSFIKKEESKGKAVILVVDEFGKVLEHAAKRNPEEELYFIQQFCEMINDHRRKTILLTTLHQNFGSYAHKLTDEQKKEWQKVKGRFKEVVFNEPVEQLLFLAAEQIESLKNTVLDSTRFSRIYDLARRCKYVSDGFSIETASKLYPLDPLAASCLTLAIQRYGQNERSLFSFLTSTGQYSLSSYVPKKNCTYNLSEVYDYLIYNFYSSISEVNIDSSNWSALRDSISRVENGILEDEYIQDAVAIVKTIGLLNIFGASGNVFDKEALVCYSENALGVTDAERIVKRLEDAKIIRYANYKSKYIIFEGTDINIETELLKAASVVPMPRASVDEIKDYIRPRVSLASASYYKTGTPRYFEFVVRNEPEMIAPEGDIDGYCELIFPLSEDTSATVYEQSASNPNANIYVLFKDVESIVRCLHEVKKLQYLLDNIAVDDKVAWKEIFNIQQFEKDRLNALLNDCIFSGSDMVEWVFKGERVQIADRKAFNKFLSQVCDKVYYATPVMRNELFNKHKLSTAISLAKANLLEGMLSSSDVEDFGFNKETFPPEKAIYLSLLRNTGLHRNTSEGWAFSDPSDMEFARFYDACVKFIEDTAEKPRKVSEFSKMLLSRPYKMKQGFVDIWIPVFLFIKQQDFALYSATGAYIPNLTKEVFDLIWKKPGDFTIKAFNVEGIRLEFFKKYRQFLNQDEGTPLKKTTFAQTYKPFLRYYKSLNEYAKSTRKFSDAATARFRDTLANASDPEKAFFEDLPEAFGYKSGALTKNDEFIADYLDKIKAAVKELNTCYPNLIKRIESRFTSALGLPENFGEYKPELDLMFHGVKAHLLTQKTKSFLDRVLAPSETATEFVEKISSAVLDKRLEQLKDKDEETLLDNIVFLFHELERYRSMSDLSHGEEGDRLFSFVMSSNSGVSETEKAYRLPKSQVGLADDIENKIKSLLSGDDNMDVCILLNLLSSKMK